MSGSLGTVWLYRNASMSHCQRSSSTAPSGSHQNLEVTTALCRWLWTPGFWMNLFDTAGLGKWKAIFILCTISMLDFSYRDFIYIKWVTMLKNTSLCKTKKHKNQIIYWITFLYCTYRFTDMKRQCLNTWKITLHLHFIQAGLNIYAFYILN